MKTDGNFPQFPTPDNTRLQDENYITELDTKHLTTYAIVDQVLFIIDKYMVDKVDFKSH